MGVSGEVTIRRLPGDRGHTGFGSLGRHLDTQTEAIAKGWARGTVYGAKANAHVITGKMKKSIRAQQTGRTQWTVKVGAFYGIYEEFGTRYREPHPFFRPAAYVQTKKAVKRFRTIFRDGPMTRIEQ